MTEPKEIVLTAILILFVILAVLAIIITPPLLIFNNMFSKKPFSTPFYLLPLFVIIWMFILLITAYLIL